MTLTPSDGFCRLMTPFRRPRVGVAGIATALYRLIPAFTAFLEGPGWRRRDELALWSQRQASRLLAWRAASLSGPKKAAGPHWPALARSCPLLPRGGQSGLEAGTCAAFRRLPPLNAASSYSKASAFVESSMADKSTDKWRGREGTYRRNGVSAYRRKPGTSAFLISRLPSIKSSSCWNGLRSPPFSI